MVLSSKPQKYNEEISIVKVHHKRAGLKVSTWYAVSAYARLQRHADHKKQWYIYGKLFKLCKDGKHLVFMVHCAQLSQL